MNRYQPDAMEFGQNGNNPFSVPYYLDVLKNCLLLAFSLGAFPVLSCNSAIDKLSESYQLMQVTAAEQRVVISQSGRELHLLETGEVFLDDLLLMQVLNHQAIFSCLSNRDRKVIFYQSAPHQANSSRQRSVQVIDVYHGDDSKYVTDLTQPAAQK